MKYKVNRKMVIALFFMFTTILLYFILQNYNKVNLYVIDPNLVIAILAILSGIGGIVMSVYSFMQARLDAVKDYFQQGDSEVFVKARNFLHDSRLIIYDDYTTKPKEVSYIINFYQMWGLLNEKRYLPIWVFRRSSGVRVVQMYLQCEPWINETRNAHNIFDAQEFEELCFRIYNKYKNNFNMMKCFDEYESYGSFKERANTYKKYLTFLKKIR